MHCLHASAAARYFITSEGASDRNGALSNEKLCATVHDHTEFRLEVDADNMDCVTKVEQTYEPGMHSVLDSGPPTITQQLPVMSVECKTAAAVDVVFQGDTYPFRSFF